MNYFLNCPSLLKQINATSKSVENHLSHLKLFSAGYDWTFVAIMMMMMVNINLFLSKNYGIHIKD